MHSTTRSTTRSITRRTHRLIPLVLVALAAGAACREANPAGPALASSSRVSANLSAALSAATLPATLPYGPYDLEDSMFHAPWTGTRRNVSKKKVLATLDSARAHGQHVILSMTLSSSNYQNPDGSFSVAKFDSILDTFASVNYAPYVADGTLIGHWLFDEPNDPTNWNGAPVPFDAIDSVAKKSKALWPTLPTIVRARPSWLAGKATAWTYLDAGWSQYGVSKGSVSAFLAADTAAAKAEHLGMVTSLQALTGGTGTGGQMTAAELRQYGTALIGEPYSCAMLLWTIRADQGGPAYFADSGVTAATDSLAHLAATKTPRRCMGS